MKIYKIVPDDGGNFYSWTDKGVTKEGLIEHFKRLVSAAGLIDGNDINLTTIKGCWKVKILCREIGNKLRVIGTNKAGGEENHIEELSGGQCNECEKHTQVWEFDSSDGLCYDCLVKEYPACRIIPIKRRVLELV